MLELERERHIEEIKQLQIKSGKLIKKLKEFKVLNEKLTADLKRSDFGGLDDAITDELQSQISRLEKRIKEVSIELEKEKTDKNNLLKKIDVLQSANERMIEMKEKQDIEMLGWQRQNKELCTRLEQVEWGIDTSESIKESKIEEIKTTTVDIGLQNKVQELTDTIQELTLDNEELQSMLEEQRTLRLNNEKAKSVEPIAENMKTEAEYLVLISENNKLSDDLTAILQEKKNLQNQLNITAKKNDELEVHLGSLTEEKISLENRLSEINITVQNATGQFEKLQQENNHLVDALTSENNELKLRLQESEDIYQQIKSENTVLTELKTDVDKLADDKSELFNALQEKNIQIQNLNESLSEYVKIKQVLEEKLYKYQIIDENQKELCDKLQVKENTILEINQKLNLVLEEK